MAKPKHPLLAALAPATAVALCCALAMAQDSPGVPDDDPALLPAEIMPRAPRSLLLALSRTGGGYLAVGERGHVLRSADGTEWDQIAQVPTRSTLTAASAVGDALWAVGHDGVILHSADGGRSWERQRADPRQPESTDPDRGRPLLDVLFVDAERGLAVGAYSLMLETVDGGRTWVERDVSAGTGGHTDEEAARAAEADESWLFSDEDLELEAEENPHLNAIARTPGGRWIIAGERGAAFRSLDDGASWERLSLPYEGSMFGVLTWGEEHVLMFGLRGNVLESFDFGDTWQAVGNGSEASLMGGLALADGGAVLVGAEGRVLVRAHTGEPFRLTTFLNEEGETPVLADVAPLAEGEYLVIGERGVGRHRPE